MSRIPLPVLPSARNHISYSALSTFTACPLRYHFRYVQGLPEETVGAGLVLGAGMHRGLQHHFEQLLAGLPAPSLDLLLDIFWEEWRCHEHQEILFGKGEDLKSVGGLAERLFHAFQQSSFSQPEGKILAVEEELRGELIPGLPDFLARLDLILETDQFLTVVDFKTARYAWTPEHVAEGAGQLLLYGELAKNMSTGKPLKLEFAVLIKTKEPSLTVHPIPESLLHPARAKRVAEQVWRAIQAGNVYPNPSPLHCPTCPYRSPCRTWGG